jgi:hypothetical protein
VQLEGGRRGTLAAVKLLKDMLSAGKTVVSEGLKVLPSEGMKIRKFQTGFLMPLRPTKLSELRDVILVRNCSIEAPDGEVSDLTVSFMRSERIEEHLFKGAVRLKCKYFDNVLTVIGGDELQVMTLLLSGALNELEIEAREGFSVWYLEKGDLAYFDFWSYQPKPSDFCLPSSYNRLSSDAFEKATQGHYLMPSHRVAIEPDRPGITTYAVQKDGTDMVDGFIGPDQIKVLSPDQLCQRLGHMILISTPEGRQLLGLSELASIKWD